MDLLCVQQYPLINLSHQTFSHQNIRNCIAFFFAVIVHLVVLFYPFKFDFVFNKTRINSKPKISIRLKTPKNKPVIKPNTVSVQKTNDLSSETDITGQSDINRFIPYSEHTVDTPTSVSINKSHVNPIEPKINTEKTTTIFNPNLRKKMNNRFGTVDTTSYSLDQPNWMRIENEVVRNGNTCFTVNTQGDGTRWFSLPKKCVGVKTQSQKLIDGIKADLNNFVH